MLISDKVIGTFTIMPPYYEVVGADDGRSWLVMVHGASHDRRYFSRQVEALSASYRVLLIDLPGHGMSSTIVGPYGLVEYAAAVRAAMVDANVAEAHYLGTHTGAGIGLLLAATGQCGFASMVLEGAVLPGFDMPYVAASLAKARALTAARGVAVAQRAWFEEAQWFDAIRANPVPCRRDEHWHMIAAFGGAPWLCNTPATAVGPIIDQLAGIDIPVLLINGEHDVADFLTVAEILNAQLSDVQRAMIAGGGGFPMWEYPDAVNPRIAAFLAEHDRR